MFFIEGRINVKINVISSVMMMKMERSSVKRNNDHWITFRIPNDHHIWDRRLTFFGSIRRSMTFTCTMKWAYKIPKARRPSIFKDMW
jgi:hypothetical protein